MGLHRAFRRMTLVFVHRILNSPAKKVRNGHALTDAPLAGAAASTWSCIPPHAIIMELAEASSAREITRKRSWC